MEQQRYGGSNRFKASACVLAGLRIASPCHGVRACSTQRPPRRLLFSCLHHVGGFQPEARRNSTFAVSDFPASWPVPSGGWVDEFLKLTGPELVRIPIPATFEGMSEGSGTFRAWAFLREWAQEWTKEGNGLTTPVRIGGGGEVVFVAFDV